MTPTPPIPRVPTRLGARAQGYIVGWSLVAYMVGVSIVAAVAVPVLAFLDRKNTRPYVCMHGWLVQTRPPHKGACPICERVRTRYQ